MGQHPHEQCQSGMFWWGSKKNPSTATREHPQQEPPTPSDPLPKRCLFSNISDFWKGLQAFGGGG